ncbi:hypothetical protein R3P38DRAFT_2808538 [Favolaschia claudopus]|uniref:Uncharacterized protein n=1 Tax=Favolaschia claudopus TaxID=2862362 RepID=A0AAV9ZFM6_9AGAR
MPPPSLAAYCSTPTCSHPRHHLCPHRHPPSVGLPAHTPTTRALSGIAGSAWPQTWDGAAGVAAVLLRLAEVQTTGDEEKEEEDEGRVNGGDDWAWAMDALDAVLILVDNGMCIFLSKCAARARRRGAGGAREAVTRGDKVENDVLHGLKQCTAGEGRSRSRPERGVDVEDDASRKAEETRGGETYIDIRIPGAVLAAALKAIGRGGGGSTDGFAYCYALFVAQRKAARSRQASLRLHGAQRRAAGVLQHDQKSLLSGPLSAGPETIDYRAAFCAPESTTYWCTESDPVLIVFWTAFGIPVFIVYCNAENSFVYRLYSSFTAKYTGLTESFNFAIMLLNTGLLETQIATFRVRSQGGQAGECTDGKSLIRGYCRMDGDGLDGLEAFKSELLTQCVRYEHSGARAPS